MRIEKDLGELAAAHRLLHHGGACARLHGHNWTIAVRVEAPVDPATAIAVDFLDFAGLWREWMDEFDHAVWLWRGDPLIPVLRGADPGTPIVLMDADPTAETLAELLVDRLRAAIPRATTWAVRVGEMAGCVAEAERRA